MAILQNWSPLRSEPIIANVLDPIARMIKTEASPTCARCCKPVEYIALSNSFMGGISFSIQCHNETTTEILNRELLLNSDRVYGFLQSLKGRKYFEPKEKKTDAVRVRGAMDDMVAKSIENGKRSPDYLNGYRPNYPDEYPEGYVDWLTIEKEREKNRKRLILDRLTSSNANDSTIESDRYSGFFQIASDSLPTLKQAREAFKESKPKEKPRDPAAERRRMITFDD